jgi:hypothetical protein
MGIGAPKHRMDRVPGVDAIFIRIFHYLRFIEKLLFASDTRLPLRHGIDDIRQIRLAIPSS